MTKSTFAQSKTCAAHLAPRTRRDRSQRGQSAVEMALILPILLLILLGIILAGFIFYAHIQVSNAVREGARAGSLYRFTQFDTPTWDLQDTVKYTIYNPATGKSALGFLPTTSSSFNVRCDISFRQTDGTYLSPSNCAGVTAAAIGSGDRVAVSLTYSYTMPIVSVMVPVFQQPFVMQSNVMMEMQ